jgi:cell division protein FtsL
VVVALVVVPMILGLVALNAVLAQTSFRIDDLSTHVNDLTDRNAELRKSVAVLSAPEQVAAWAQHHGMTPPDPRDVHVLHPPTHGGGGGP